LELEFSTEGPPLTLPKASTRSRYAETIRASSALTRRGAAALSELDAMVLMAVEYIYYLAGDAT